MDSNDIKHQQWIISNFDLHTISHIPVLLYIFQNWQIPPSWQNWHIDRFDFGFHYIFRIKHSFCMKLRNILMYMLCQPAFMFCLQIYDSCHRSYTYLRINTVYLYTMDSGIRFEKCVVTQHSEIFGEYLNFSIEWNICYTILSIY